MKNTKNSIFRSIPINLFQSLSIINFINQISTFIQSIDYEINQQKQTQVKTLNQQINHLFYKVYNITEEEIKIIEGEI